MTEYLYDAFVQGWEEADMVTIQLLAAGVSFNVELWPEGQWRIAVKQDASHLLDKALRAAYIYSSGGHA